MSDQVPLFLPPTDETEKWWEIALACIDCQRTTTRPPRSEEPCGWCGGDLLAVVRA